MKSRASKAASGKAVMPCVSKSFGVKPHILPTWVDDPTVISMVSHGLGVSMMTELTVRGRTDGVKLLPVEPASSRELGLAVRSLDAASDGLRHFIDCTKRVVAEMQP